MAEPIDIFDYLPKSYKTNDEENYITFLWESYESNYTNSKYQFAFIAYHLLFMTYVYFQVWKIYNVRAEDFKMSVLGFEKLDALLVELEERNRKNQADGKPIEMLYPFSFSEVHERTIMMFFKLIGCDKSKIGRYKKLVDDRNEIAHANGKLVFVASANLDKKTDEILELVAEIQRHSIQMIEATLIRFLTDSWDANTREFIDDREQIDEILIRGSYLSQKDIEHLVTFDVNRLSVEPNFETIKQLFESFKQNYLVAAEQ